MAEVAALASFATLLSLALDTVKSVDLIRRKITNVSKIRRQLVTISQALMSLQNALLDLSWTKRFVVMPHSEHTISSLTQDLVAIRDLVLQHCRAESGLSTLRSYVITEDRLDFDDLVSYREPLARYEAELRKWIKSSRSLESTVSASNSPRSQITPTEKTLPGLAEDDQLRVLQWISPVDHRERHKEVQMKQVLGTGDWFFHDEFAHWRDSLDPSILWVHGVAGSGKTFLASRAIDHLSAYVAERNAQIAYAYYDFRSRRTWTELCGSLLKQLLSTSREIPAIAGVIFTDHSDRGPPSISDLAYIFLDTAPLPVPVNIIIDGLDEPGNCTPIEFSTILHVLSRSNTRIMVFSRAHASKAKRIEELPLALWEISISPRSHDLELIIQKILNTKKGRVDLRELIHKVAYREHESFIPTVYTVHNILDSCYTTGQVRLALERSLQAPLSAAIVLSGLVDRIQGQENTYLRDLGSYTLNWLCHAKRPMTTQEICEAYAIQMSQSDIQTEEIPDASFIERSCMGLITIDSAMTVNFAHLAVLDEIKKHVQTYTQGLQRVSRDCLIYLTLQNIRESSSLQAAWTTHPFLNYAESYWTAHLQDMRRSGVEPDHPLLVNVINSISQYGMRQWSSPDAPLTSSRFNLRMTVPLHLVTGLSPMHVCARFGFAEVAQKLDREKSKPQDFHNVWSTTPFHEAARSNSVSFLALLGPGDRPLQPDCHGRYATHYASYHGCGEFLQAFLGKYPDSAGKADQDGTTPLIMASALDQSDVVQTLLAAKVSVNATDQKGSTALHYAARIGHYEIVQRLLTAGANATVVDRAGNNLLHCAVLARSAMLVRLFRINGTDLHARTQSERSLLHIAASKSDPLSVTRLIAEGADVSYPAINDKHRGTTPLMEAVKSGDEETVKILIRYGADINYVSEYEPNDKRSKNAPTTALSAKSSTALITASRLGQNNIAYVLLRAGADPNRASDSRATPLAFAAASGHLEIVHMLLEHGADVNATTDLGLTPLHLAAPLVNSSVIEILLNAGANPHLKTRSGESVYDHVVKYGSTSVQNIILQRLIKQDSRSTSPMNHRATDDLALVGSEFDRDMQSYKSIKKTKDARYWRH